MRAEVLVIAIATAAMHAPGASGGHPARLAATLCVLCCRSRVAVIAAAEACTPLNSGAGQGSKRWRWGICCARSRTRRCGCGAHWTWR